MTTFTYLGDLAETRSGMTVDATVAGDGLRLRWGGALSASHERHIPCADIADVLLTSGRRITAGHKSGIVDFWARWDSQSDYLVVRQRGDRPAFALEGSRGGLVTVAEQLCRRARARPPVRVEAEPS